jgi:hypothetical protein
VLYKNNYINLKIGGITMKRKLNLMVLGLEDHLTGEKMNDVCAGAPYLCDSGGCACGCIYENEGGSNTIDNYSANSSGGLHTPGYSYEGPQPE